MKNIRRLLAAIALAAGFSAPAWSASYSTDQSDLWWIPNESGWGIQFVQRNSTIFATMFVYDQSNAPTWYVATMVATGLTWAGDLYATRGPWFGMTPFNLADVQATKVGTMTWVPTPATVRAGTLTYTVNGTQVTKNVQRQFIAMDDFNGDYGGNLHQVNSGCSDSTKDGTSDLVAVFVVKQTENNFVLGIGDENGKSCAFTGTLAQAGQMGNVTGTFNCSDGSAGTFLIDEMQVTETGLTLRFVQQSPVAGCSTTGWFGGGRATTL